MRSPSSCAARAGSAAGTSSWLYTPAVIQQAMRAAHSMRDTYSLVMATCWRESRLPRRRAGACHVCHTATARRCAAGARRTRTESNTHNRTDFLLPPGDRFSYTLWYNTVDEAGGGRWRTPARQPEQKSARTMPHHAGGNDQHASPGRLHTNSKRMSRRAPNSDAPRIPKSLTTPRHPPRPDCPRPTFTDTQQPGVYVRTAAEQPAPSWHP